MIHVGLAKCGSSSLQGYCAKHSGWLLKQKIKYPEWDPYFNHHYKLFDWLKKRQHDEALEWVLKMRDHAAVEGAESMFLSQEQLYTRFWFMKEIDYELMLGFLDGLEKEFDQVRLICITREWKSFFRSYLKQNMANTGAPQWDKMLNVEKPRGSNYLRYLLLLMRSLKQRGTEFLSLDELSKEGPYPSIFLEKMFGIRIPWRQKAKLKLNKSPDSLLKLSLSGALIGVGSIISKEHPNSKASDRERKKINAQLDTIFGNPSVGKHVAKLEDLFRERVNEFSEMMVDSLSVAELAELKTYMQVERPYE